MVAVPTVIIFSIVDVLYDTLHVSLHVHYITSKMMIFANTCMSTVLNSTCTVIIFSTVDNGTYCYHFHFTNKEAKDF